ncbi:MAG TPA: RNA polymerase subunit sigma-24 [Anaerolineaceae bacterium]|jgi:RNA polymerase sigma-70 factor (ECF subfamily)|nr:RNA polymerase subunit sigma-24 [Anaerolineaceae bacterium]
MNTESIPESSLSLEALKKGDRHELARMVDLYSDKIYRLALKFTNNPQDAEDVLQETFLKAMRALPEFEGRSSLSTWLYRIAVNESLMLLRKQKPDLALDTPAEEEDSEEGGSSNGLILADWCCLPEEELLSEESRRFLDQAIQQLPATLRSVFILRDIEGMSIRETADLLGLTETNVKTRLLRARLFLRQQLSRYFGERLKEWEQK